MGGWLQVEFLKCSISEMTNSLFEKGETKTGGERNRHKGAKTNSLLALPSKQRTETSLLPRSFSILDGKMVDYKDKREWGLLRLQQLVCTLTGKRRGGLLFIHIIQ